MDKTPHTFVEGSKRQEGGKKSHKTHMESSKKNILKDNQHFTSSYTANSTPSRDSCSLFVFIVQVTLQSYLCL